MVSAQRRSCSLKIQPEEVLAFRKFHHKEVLAVLTSNHKKPQEVASLWMLKEVLVCALFFGYTVF